MTTTYRDRFTAAPSVFTSTTLGETHEYDVPGHVVFPEREVPLFLCDKDNRPLGFPIAKVQVLSANHISDNGSVRTTGEYRVSTVFYIVGRTAQDLGSYLRNPIHDPPKNNRPKPIQSQTPDNL